MEEQSVILLSLFTARYRQWAKDKFIPYYKQNKAFFKKSDWNVESRQMAIILDCDENIKLSDAMRVRLPIKRIIKMTLDADNSTEDELPAKPPVKRLPSAHGSEKMDINDGESDVVITQCMTTSKTSRKYPGANNEKPFSFTDLQLYGPKRIRESIY